MSGGGAGSNGGSNNEPPPEIVIPFDPAPTVGFAVFFRHDAASGDLPDEAHLRIVVEDWIRQHAADPLQEGLLQFLREGLVTFLVRQRGNPVPDPPDEIIRAYNPGETEERRYRNANYVVFVGATDWVAPPRVGLWAVFGAACALAAHLPGGVIVDPEFPRLLPLQNHDVPASGDIRIVQHIVLPYSHDSRTGFLWMTTKGMGRFGLPDLEIRDVPPNLAQNLMPVMNGMAQKLMAGAAGHAAPTDDGDHDPLREQGFPCPSEVLLSIADIARAYGDAAPANDEAGAAGATRIRLTVSRQRGGGDAVFVRLLPPRSGAPEGVKANEPISTGVWLHQLLTDLFGAEPNLAAVEQGDSDMEAAHNEAVAALPRVRARFAHGLSSGEVLHVKYGFPVGGANGWETEDEENDDNENYEDDDNGHEFMWIAVTSWSEGGRVRGSLANDPQYRHDLKAGQAVEISEEDIYDWMIVYPDGRHEGAFTNAVLEGMDSADEPPPA